MNDPSNRGSCRSLKFEQVLERELKYFGKWTPRPGHVQPDTDIQNECDTESAQERVTQAHKARLSGLAFSGGGIRSATFNLGVMQALSRLGLLGQFDYLSTVSGGGYIGSWFAAWVHRANLKSIDKGNEDKAGASEAGDEKVRSGLELVSSELASSVSAREVNKPRAAMQPDPAPISHLREYSNYLSPLRGLWSTDAWTLGITYLRNLLLTLSLLLTTLVTLVLLTRILTSFYFNIAHGQYQTADTAVPIFFNLCIFVASLLAGIELCGRPAHSRKLTDMSYYAVAFAWATAAIGVLWLWLLRKLDFSDMAFWLLPLAISPLLGWLSGRWLGNIGGQDNIDTDNKQRNTQFKIWLWVGSPLLSVLAMIVLLGVLHYWIAHWPLDDIGDGDSWRIVVWGIPLFVLIFSMVAVVFVGSASGELSELDREWLGRFFAALFKLTVLSTFLMVLVVYSSYWVEWLASFEFGAATATTAWGVLSAAGAFLARNVMIGKSGLQGKLQKLVIVMAPYIFILGVLILTTWITEQGVNKVNSLIDSSTLLDHFTDPLTNRFILVDIGLCAITGLFMLFWSWRVGVNRFSLHSMYADRLIRAYLGASNLKRNAHPFTGFDDGDNEIHIHELKQKPYADGEKDSSIAPYPIINAAINLVSSKRLAWQKRKAESFTFTPLFCGYEFCGEKGKDNKSDGERTQRIGGFVDSACYAGENGGVSLGKAMAISGAAASPNMGFHSSSALTFLMTTFNVRLGWWLPNTAKQNPKLLVTRGPALGLMYLWFELLGKTNADRDYVYLSDGGHFENLGIYELVRRRCRIIVACDAEADSNMEFSGLGNAIEKCQIDLGVPIDIDVSQIKPDSASGHSLWHCAVGCIRYSEADKDQSDGTLVYIKASMSGDEPLSVETYANSHSDFPHQTTADQWFDESQFESYRALGEHITMKVLENAKNVAESTKGQNQRMLERVILEMRKQWYRGATTTTSKPADHDSLLESILDTLRNDTRLSFLDGQLYPNLKKVADKHFKYKNKKSLPGDYGEFRAGFYFCKRLIQFMQQLYYDRQLDLEHEAPINRGWMNLFRRWSWSRMLRFTWTMTAGTYGARFQSFCEHRLGLHSGEPEFGKALKIIATPVPTAEQKAGDYHVSFNQATKNGKHNAINWQQVEQGKPGLHYYETHLIREFIDTYVKHLDACIEQDQTGCRPEEVGVFYIYPLKVTTNDPVSGEDDKIMKLNAGFLIVGTARMELGEKTKPPYYDKAGLYFRIRPSMRNMDLARKALQQCRKIKTMKKMQLVNLEPTSNTPQYRRYRDVYSLEQQSLDRCRWFSELQEEFTDNIESPDEK